MNGKMSDIGQFDEEERDSDGLVSRLVGDSTCESAISLVPLDEDLLPEGFPDEDPADMASYVIGDVRHPDAP